MYTINTTIEGVAPFLFNRFTEESKSDIDKGTAGGKKSIQQREVEVLVKVYRNDNGLYLPAQSMKKCLLVGITMGKLKEGRSSARSFVEATVFIHPQEIEFGKNEPDFIHECMGRRPPKTGGACIIRRPGLKEGWELSFSLTVTDDRRDPELLRRGMEEAGLLAGIGDWRPEFGRFIVKKWEVKK